MCLLLWTLVGSTTHAWVYEDVSSCMRGGNIRLIQAWQSAKLPGLDNQVDGPGIQPTRLNTQPWRVQKGRPLWHIFSPILPCLKVVTSGPDHLTPCPPRAIVCEKVTTKLKLTLWSQKWTKSLEKCSEEALICLLYLIKFRRNSWYFKFGKSKTAGEHLRKSQANFVVTHAHALRNHLFNAMLSGFYDWDMN